MTGRDEYEFEMERSNYTRAVHLAEEEGLGDEAIDAAQSAAFKQATGEHFNFRGAENLARSWDFTADKVATLCNELLEDFEQREEAEGRTIKVFDIDKMDHVPVTKLISLFRDRYR